VVARPLRRRVHICVRAIPLTRRYRSTANTAAGYSGRRCAVLLRGYMRAMRSVRVRRAVYIRLSGARGDGFAVAVASWTLGEGEGAG
jgi:hypothetical protein